jgi:Arm DNA-binding domain
VSSNPTALKFLPAQIAALKPTGKSYDLSDPAVPNLLLRVGPNGTKRWLFRYQWKKKRTRIAIGDFPEIGVAQARERAITHQNQINRGIDPRATHRPGIAHAAGDGVELVRVTRESSNGPTQEHTTPINRDDPLSIPQPDDPDDKHSVHFLAYEYVEYYVKRQREGSREVVRILKKMCCLIGSVATREPSARERSSNDWMPSWPAAHR